MACAQTIPPQNLVARVLYYGLQPAILLAVIGVWLSQPTNPTLFVGCVLAVQLVLGVLEHLYPARAEWRLNGKQRSSSIVLVLILFFVAGAVGDFYTQVLDPFLSSLREQLGVHMAPSLAAVGSNVRRVFSQRTAVVLGASCGTSMVCGLAFLWSWGASRLSKTWGAELWFKPPSGVLLLAYACCLAGTDIRYRRAGLGCFFAVGLSGEHRPL